MSALVKLSSKLPGDYEVNGIDPLAADLVDDPREIRVALLWYDVEKVTVDTDSGDHIPTIRTRRIEPLGTVTEVPDAVRDAVQLAVEARTGRRPIPFGIVDVEDGDDPDQLAIDDDADQ